MPSSVTSTMNRQDDILESVSLMKSFVHNQLHHQQQHQKQQVQQQVQDSHNLVGSIAPSVTVNNQQATIVPVTNTAPATIPQEIATMSDNDLISFINPNAFDQGNYWF